MQDTSDVFWEICSVAGQDQLHEFRIGFHETISNDFFIQGNAKSGTSPLVILCQLFGKVTKKFSLDCFKCWKPTVIQKGMNFFKYYGRND